jgi:exosome complex RNA-binding protein Rrp42 (RNase PH superfamily)
MKKNIWIHAQKAPGALYVQWGCCNIVLVISLRMNAPYQNLPEQVGKRPVPFCPYKD